jgi:hypothetical protein
MPIPTGTVYFSQIRTEMSQGAGGGYAGTMPLNDATFRSRLTDTGQNATLYLSTIRGNAYQRFTIAADTTNYDIRSALIAAGWNGTNKGSADVVVNGGVVVGTPSIGAYAMDTGGPWPGPSTIVVYNSGYIVGMGGAGGAGARPSGVSVAGSAGGPALRAQRAMTLVNSGIVGGGGGGGGGGNGINYNNTIPFPSGPITFTYSNGGGGGGGGRTGRTDSAGGAGNTPTGDNPSPGKPGAVGTFAGGGLGGQGGGGGPSDGGDGGAGGDWGTVGGTGGRNGKVGGAGGVSVQGWSVVTAPTGTAGIMGPTAG